MDSQRTLQIVIQARDEATKVIGGVGESFAGLVKSSQAASFAFAGALAFTGKAIIDVASSMEQAKVAFTTFLGSSTAASKSLKQLSDFAKVTPFTFPTITDAAKRLLAYGVAADDLIPTLKNLGDISAGVGTDKLPQLILAFGQVKAKTTLAGTELRQFTETGIPLIGALAKQLGVAESSIADMASEGKISFGDVQKALQSMTSQGGKFFNLMDKQSQTFSGRMSNISDQLVRVALNIAGISTNAQNFGEVVKGGAFDLLSSGAQKVLDVLNALEPKVKGFIEAFLQNKSAIGAVMGILVGGLLGAATALIAFLSPLLILMGIGAAVGVAIGFLSDHLVLASGIFTSLAIIIGSIVIPAFIGWAIAAGSAAVATLIALAPIIIVAAAIGAAVALLFLIWQKNFGGIQEKTAAVVTFLKGVVEWIKQNFVNVILGAIDLLTGGWTTKFNIIKRVVEGVIGVISNLIGKIRELASAKSGGSGGGFSFQHGGFVPGAYNQAVPAILHGGERVIPRNGLDVARGGTSGGITINMNGPVSMDSGDRVRELAEEVIRIMGRQNELAGKGLAT